MTDINIATAATLVTDPSSIETKSGIPFVTFRVVVNHRRFDKVNQLWMDGDATFFSVSCWRNLASNVLNSIRKGDPVVIHGKLRVRDWRTDEKSGTSIEIEASHIGPDLNRGTAEFLRNLKSEDEEVQSRDECEIENIERKPVRK
ncbi:MAG: single-stranded DNA-binding protein [Candidatus Nanopelagicales bacterium]